MGATKGKQLEAVTCPLCNGYSSKRLTQLCAHFESTHGKTDQGVWDELHGERPTCACGCGESVRWNGWSKGYSRVVSGHNGSIYAMYSAEEAAKISEKRAGSLKGKTSWAKGLSKETDARIAERAQATAEGRKASFARGDIEVWNKGLSREDDERVAAAGDALKIKYAEGLAVPWAKGLSKETDERVMRMTMNVSLSMRKKSIRDHLDGMKRLTLEEVKRRIETSGDLEVVEGLENYTNDASRVIVVKCKKCQETLQGSLRTLGKGRCFRCAPGGSAAQEEVARYIEGLGLEIKRNDRKTMSLELDVYVPAKSVAIEYNGLYWHSHINKSSNYHSMKSKTARESGVALIHVFEDEWREKCDIVKSIIRSKLGLSVDKVGARRCEIVELGSRERQTFFEENHLDGDVRSEVAWGLKHEGRTVYALSLRKPFHKKNKDALEVARCCPALNMSVPGGLSRLVKTAVQYCNNEGVSKMITYVDTRLGGSGSGYEKSGFVKMSETVPRWWWTDLNIRFNRFKFKADSSRGLSESEVAEEAGVVKIWGCENVVYALDV